MTHLRRCRLRRAAFTLVELLVVIAIIIILASLLVPAVNRAREAARIADTQATLHGLQAALQVFESEFGALPPVTELDDDGDLIQVEVNVQFLDPDYRSGDTSILDGGNEDWMPVRVVEDDPWIWEDNDGDGYCETNDLLDDDTDVVDLSEVLFLMVGTTFLRTDDDGDPVGVFQVTNGATGQVRVYYAKANNTSPYAELAGSRVGDLDLDTYPEVLDSFTNPIILTVGLRNPEASELCSLGPDGRLDFIDQDDDGSWDSGEPGNNGIDDDDDGLIDEKDDELNHIPELNDDIVTWE